MANPLATKLSSFTELSDDERSYLDTLCSNVRTYQAKRDLIREGQRPEFVFLLLEGWVCRYKVLPDGGRQIMAYLVPGDLCDPHIFILDEMDHSLGALTKAKVALIPKDKILELTDRWPNLTRALWWSTLVDEGILREWLANMGRRSARDRIAHLLVEIYLRMKAVGLTSDKGMTFPLSQEVMGDTLGLTAIHVNRMLQSMRKEGLIGTQNRRLTIPDVDKLIEASGFTSNYLHLGMRIANPQKSPPSDNEAADVKAA